MNESNAARSDETGPSPTIPPRRPPSASYGPVPIAVDDPRRKSPLLASFLSAVPGLGQVYVGYYQRGFIHALITFSLIAILANRSLGFPQLYPLVGPFLFFFWLYNIIDAGRRATFYNYALAGGTDITLPEDITPAVGGSVPVGIALIAVGAVFLSNTLFGISLEWLEDWWPMALIAAGGFLVYRAKQDRSAPAGDDASLAEYE